jgi:hypothetical protein
MDVESSRRKITSYFSSIFVAFAFHSSSVKAEFTLAAETISTACYISNLDTRLLSLSTYGVCPASLHCIQVPQRILPGRSVNDSFTEEEITYESSKVEQDCGRKFVAHSD